MSSMEFTQRADGSTVYTTVDGDVIDLIAFTFYGSHDRTSELLLEANPHILALDAVLPSEIEIVLPPDPPEPERISTLSLWD